MKTTSLLRAGVALWIGLAPAAYAAQYVYPAKGQSKSLQAHDEAHCSSWAIKKSGFDPATPPPAPAEAQRVTGSGARLIGAGGGAAVAGIAGGNAGTGALVGAAAGGIGKRVMNRRSANQQNETIAQHRAAGQAAYDNARAACLTGRGYSVR
jgi:hypothetical protein